MLAVATHQPGSDEHQVPTERGMMEEDVIHTTIMLPAPRQLSAMQVCLASSLLRARSTFNIAPSP